MHKKTFKMSLGLFRRPSGSESVSRTGAGAGGHKICLVFWRLMAILGAIVASGRPPTPWDAQFGGNYFLARYWQNQAAASH